MNREGERVTQAIRDEIALHGADRYIHTTRTRCNGRCADACVVIAYPEGLWYKDITPELGRQLVRRHLEGKRLEGNLVYSYDHEFVARDNAGLGTDKVSLQI